jgi:hypothetical protein
MSGLFCLDGEPADITPWVSIPPAPKGWKGPRIYEHERDRCRRCGLLSWQHHNLPPLSDAAREAIRSILMDGAT